MQPQTAILDVRAGTVSSIRTRAASDNVKVKTNMVSENFVTQSLNTKAIIRGVNWALASWTASSNAEERKTIKVSIAAASVPIAARRESGESWDSRPVFFSS